MLNRSLKMSTISFDPFFRSSVNSCSFDFKFPAKTRTKRLSTVEFGGDALKVSLHTDTAINADSNENCHYGRRGILFMSTLPFLLYLHDSVEDIKVKAAVSNTSEILLVKQEVRKVLSKGKAAGVLRLVFHDAGTFEANYNSGGMNGSLVYELDRPENAGLKKSLKILEKAKNEVDAIQLVSWADMIAVAGAEAVSLCGGPTISVQLGRQDSMVPDPEGKLPEESSDASALKQCFRRIGLSTQELVALSGAHTLGSKGFGSPTIFDNSYYKVLLEKPSSAGMAGMIGLPSDHALVEDDECLSLVKLLLYADGLQNMPAIRICSLKILGKLTSNLLILVLGGKHYDVTIF